jgi:hypothetical protein
VKRCDLNVVGIAGIKGGGGEALDTNEDTDNTENKYEEDQDNSDQDDKDQDNSDQDEEDQDNSDEKDQDNSDQDEEDQDNSDQDDDDVDDEDDEDDDSDIDDDVADAIAGEKDSDYGKMMSERWELQNDIENTIKDTEHDKINPANIFGHKNMGGILTIADKSYYCLKNAILAILKEKDLKKKWGVKIYEREKSNCEIYKQFYNQIYDDNVEYLAALEDLDVLARQNPGMSIHVFQQHASDFYLSYQTR